MTIICIGDSHASFFSGLGTREKQYMQPPLGYPNQQNIIPYFIGIRIGPATAYQLMNKLNILQDIIAKYYKQGDTVLFCFGEVDCRLHLPKRILLKNEDENTVIKECIDRYFNVIKTLNVKSAVWGVIGSTHPILQYPEIWRIGTMEQRNHISIIFNKMLEEKCKEYNIPFISIFPYMVKDLVTDYNAIQDDLHLSQSMMPITLNLFIEKGLI